MAATQAEDTLRDLQKTLENAYRIEMPLLVCDFVFSDSEIAHSLHPAAVIGKEALLVRQSPEGLELSLYLDADDLRCLGESDPAAGVAGPGLDRFCRIAEGVSHFVLLTWRFLQCLPVTRLELELQAEVDKFLVCRLAGYAESGDLVDALFTKSHLRSDLTDGQRDRYERASALAREYCTAISRMEHGDMLEEIRRFYRLGQTAKVAHIAGL